jgi:hypothetical protein
VLRYWFHRLAAFQGLRVSETDMTAIIFADDGQLAATKLGALQRAFDLLLCDQETTPMTSKIMNLICVPANHVFVQSGSQYHTVQYSRQKSFM